MCDKGKFLHENSPVTSIQVIFYIDISYGRKNRKKGKYDSKIRIKNDDYWYYFLRHAITIEPVMITPINVIKGDKGIAEGLLIRTGDNVTGTPSLTVT